MAEPIKLLLVGKDGQGGMVQHPGQFGIPEKKKIAERWFFNSGRARLIGEETIPVFTEEGFRLNIDDFADAVLDTPEESTQDSSVALEGLHAVVNSIVGIYGIDSSEYQTALREIAEWHNKNLGAEVAL